MSSPQAASESAAQPCPLPSGPTPTNPGKSARVLACQLCQGRKIKCDRKSPCSNCIKTNQPCIPSTPAPARKRRRPNQELQERLAKLESLISKGIGSRNPDGDVEQDSSVKMEDSPPPPSITPGSSGSAQTGNGRFAPDEGLSGSVWHGRGSHARDRSDHARDMYQSLSSHGRLVKEEGGDRFMDSALLGTIYDELQAMRALVDAGDNEENTPDTVGSDDNSEMVLSPDTPPSTSPADFWPHPGSVHTLWQTYLARVNPLTKIIHVPTLEQLVLEATLGWSSLSKPVEALLFSIWLMAAVAMTPNECQALLGCSRDAAVDNFSKGVRLALVRLGFLRTHDMRVLQALVIYLMSLQGRYNRQAAWCLNGVVVRIAQAMGLHRDGELLGLSPFDSEMRRRLWWQIVMLDGKYAMMTGLNHSILPRDWDTKEPKNINDADMSISATEPFQDSDGPTEMIFVLITNKVARFLIETPGLEIMHMVSEWTDAPSDANPELNHVRKVIAQLGQDLLDIIDKYCDPNGSPVHKMASEVKVQITRKLKVLTSPPSEQSERESETSGDKDNAFRLAISAMEHEQENCAASQDTGFIWQALLHFQLDVFVYLAGQLCHRFDGPLVDRAWRQVEAVYHYHHELFDLGNNKTHLMLARFLLEAWSKRRDVLYRKSGHMPETPFCIAKIQRLVQVEDSWPGPATYNATESTYTGFATAAPDIPDLSDDHFFGAAVVGATDNVDFDMLASLPPNMQNGFPPSYYMNPNPFGSLLL